MQYLIPWLLALSVWAQNPPDPAELEDQSAPATLDSIQDLGELQSRLADTCVREGILQSPQCSEIEGSWLRLGQIAYKENDLETAQGAWARALDLSRFHHNFSLSRHVEFWQMRMALDTLQNPEHLGLWAQRLLSFSPAQDSMGVRLCAHIYNSLRLLDPSHPALDSLKQQIPCKELKNASILLACTQTGEQIASAITKGKFGPKDMTILLGAQGQRFGMQNDYEKAAQAWNQKRTLILGGAMSKLDLFWGVELWHLGNFYTAQDNPVLATQVLGEACEIDQQNPWLPKERRYRLWMDYVKALQKMGRFEEAADYLRKAVELRRGPKPSDLSETND